jgi:hypothetical protein
VLESDYLNPFQAADATDERSFQAMHMFADKKKIDIRLHYLQQSMERRNGCFTPVPSI